MGFCCQVDFWLKELQKSGPQDIAIAVVGCKLDLVKESPSRRMVSVAEAENYAAKVGAKHFETSARTGADCHAPFDYLGDEFVMMRKNRPELQSSRDRVEVSAPSPVRGVKCC